MPAGKKFVLSIILKTRDRAGRGLKALRRGLAAVKRAARAVGVGLLAVGAAIGGALFALKKFVDIGDNLAKTSDRIGITIDTLAQLRFAAEQSGVSAEDLDKSIEGLGKRIGEAKAETGSLFTLLKKVSPELLARIQEAKDAGEGFDIMATAIQKLEDPTKKAALASAAFGRSGVRLTNLLSQGPKAIAKLRKEYFDLAGSQEGSARASEKINDALNRTKQVLVGVAGSIITALAPSLLKLSGMATRFFQGNRAGIQAWVKDFGEKIPGRITALIGFLKRLAGAVSIVLEFAREILIVFGAFKVGGLIGSFGAAGGAMNTFARGLGGAVIGLGLLIAGMGLLTKAVAKRQEQVIKATVKAKSLKRQLEDPGFKGTIGAFKAAKEEGLITRRGGFDRQAIGRQLLSEGDRGDLGVLGKTLGPEGVADFIERKVGKRIDAAITGLEVGRVKLSVAEQRNAPAAPTGLEPRLGDPTVKLDGKLKIELFVPPGARVTKTTGSGIPLELDLKTGPQT